MRGSFRQLSPEKGSQSGRTKAGGRPLGRTQRYRRLPYLIIFITITHAPLINICTYSITLYTSHSATRSRYTCELTRTSGSWRNAND